MTQAVDRTYCEELMKKRNTLQPCSSSKIAPHAARDQLDLKMEHGRYTLDKVIRCTRARAEDVSAGFYLDNML